MAAIDLPRIFPHVQVVVLNAGASNAQILNIPEGCTSLSVLAVTNDIWFAYEGADGVAIVASKGPAPAGSWWKVWGRPESKIPGVRYGLRVAADIVPTTVYVQYAGQR